MVSNPFGLAGVENPEDSRLGAVLFPLDALSAELLAVVDQTVQPTRAALWLRPTPRRA